MHWAETLATRVTQAYPKAAVGIQQMSEAQALRALVNGGADVALPPENYLIPVDTRGTFCLALAGTDGGVSVVGNIQQQGFRVVFDGDKQRVGLVPRSC